MPMARRALVTALTVYLASSISADSSPIHSVQAVTRATLPSNVRDSGLSIINPMQALPAAGTVGAGLLTSVDYSPATWTAAASTNYTVATRADDYPVEMIVIHDIEGSAASAIKAFQDPTRHGSAHYVTSYKGQVWQMVNEKDIAWHAGNWDYNTRSIGIENEGYAYTPGLYTVAEYAASARLAASICSRWGVPMDRTHVIGHYQVPDPYHKGLYGGDSHHTDPGPYWNWTYYMYLARKYANVLPSPPHMMVDPVAVPWDQSAIVTWRPAHSCHAPIASYRVVLQPGNIVVDLPGNVTTATVGGLQNGTSYSFTVTAINSYGESTLQSNSVIPGPHCATAGLTSSLDSPQELGTKIQLSASSTICPNPTYQFWLRYPNGKWVTQGAFGGGKWNWDTALNAPGVYTIRAWANQSGDTGHSGAYADVTFSMTEPPPCTSANLSPNSATQPAGSTISFTAGSTGCTTPLYAYWVMYPGGTWHAWRSLSTDPNWSWSTAGLAPGTYTVRVWVNHPGHPTTFPELLASTTVTLTGCTSASLAPGSGSAKAGTPVKFTATSSGCPNPVYEFWISYRPGTWRQMTGFGANTWTWNNTGWATGVYHVRVRANQQGAYTGTYETYGSSTFTLL
jgi:N-acetylmuramoyl-L-alanine amidase/Fibronectin type III domain